MSSISTPAAKSDSGSETQPIPPSADPDLASTLIGCWSCFASCGIYSEVTFREDHTYSWRSTQLGKPGRYPEDPQKRFPVFLSQSVPITDASYQPPEHFPHWGTWKILTNDEWLEWFQGQNKGRKPKKNSPESSPRACIQLAKSILRIQRFDGPDHVYHDSFGTKGLDVLLLSQPGNELYSATGDFSASTFRRGGWPDPLPNLPYAGWGKPLESL